nr:hypothetical protein [Tanacetum cinerariifolium]
MQTTEGKVDTNTTLDASLVDTESCGTEFEKRDISSRSGNDVDVDNVGIKLVYDEEPLAEVNLHAKVPSNKTTNRNKPVKQINIAKKLEGQILTRNRWVPMGNIFTSSTTKVDSEPSHGFNTDITNLYECIQTLDLSAGTSLNVQEEKNLDLSACTRSNLKKKIKAWIKENVISGRARGGSSYPPSPASESEPEDVIEVEDTVEYEDETIPASVHEVGESFTTLFFREDSDGLLPGLMRRDTNSLFSRMASLSRQLYGRKTAHTLVEKKGTVKDEYYGKLIFDLGNEVRSSVEEGTDAMENLDRKCLKADSMVANAACNYEILYKRDDDNAERPDKRQKSGDRHQPTTQQSSHRNHGHNNDRQRSDRRGSGDNHRSNNNYSGNNNRSSSNGRDQRNRGQQSNRSVNSGSQQSRGPSEGYSYLVCTTYGRRHLGECHRAAGTCFKYGQTGHLQKDYKKNTAAST